MIECIHPAWHSIFKHFLQKVLTLAKNLQEFNHHVYFHIIIWHTYEAQTVYKENKGRERYI